MTPADAAKLLTLVHAYDGRKPDQARAHAWADALTDLNPDDCAQAVRRYFRTNHDWIMPAHIRRIVRDIRDEQARDTHAWRQLQPAPDQCVPMPPAVKAQILEFAQRRTLPT